MQNTASLAQYSPGSLAPSSCNLLHRRARVHICWTFSFPAEPCSALCFFDRVRRLLQLLAAPFVHFAPPMRLQCVVAFEVSAKDVVQHPPKLLKYLTGALSTARQACGMQVQVRKQQLDQRSQDSSPATTRYGALLPCNVISLSPRSANALMMCGGPWPMTMAERTHFAHSTQ